MDVDEKSNASTRKEAKHAPTSEPDSDLNMEHRGCVSILRNGHRPKPCFFGWEPHGSRSEARSSSDHLARKRQRTDNNCSVSCFSGRHPAGGKQSADGAAKPAAHDLRRRRIGDLFGNRLSRGSGKPRGESPQDSVSVSTRL